MALQAFSTDLLTSLTKAGLAPGLTPLIPTLFKPTTKLEVRYGEREVSLGNYLKTGETAGAPSVSFGAEEEGGSENYILLLTDPDAPTPEDPKFAFWRHWLLSGLKPSTSSTATSSEPALTEYLGPGGKEADATPHRYLFLLFRQPEDFSLKKEDVGGEEFVQRRSWKVVDFIKENHLVLVSVNWFSGVGDAWKA